MLAMIPAMRDKKTNSAAGGVGAMVALVLFAGCAIAMSHDDNSGGGSSTPTTHSEQDVEASVLDTCEDAVKKDLKDPDSAKFGDDWKAWYITSGSQPPAGMSYSPLSGDRYYNAGGTVNGKNSYGAYAGGEDYYCDVVVTTGGDIHAQARPMADLLPPT